MTTTNTDGTMTMAAIDLHWAVMALVDEADLEWESVEVE